MYIHLGNNVIIKKENIIGVFDMDTSTVSKKTRDFLENAEKNGKVFIINYELPKSFILVNENGNNEVYISQLSSTTLYKRNLEKLENMFK